MRSFDYNTLANKTWDTDILNLVAKIHECKGRQDLYIRQKPVELDRLVEIARIQSTEASNRIEGIVTTSGRMKKLFEEKILCLDFLHYPKVLHTVLATLYISFLDNNYLLNNIVQGHCIFLVDTYLCIYQGQHLPLHNYF